MMSDELSERQAAIRRRLAGETIEAICQSLHHAEVWFHKWWRRYLDQGPDGVYDLTRANEQVVNRTAPHIERAVITIRRRLTARSTPQTRCGLVGAATIRNELKSFGRYVPAHVAYDRADQRPCGTDLPAAALGAPGSPTVHCTLC